MSRRESNPLARMRSIATLTFVVAVGIAAGVLIVVGSTTIWQPLIAAPSIAVAVWEAARWHTPLNLRVAMIGLVVTEITWLFGALFTLGPVFALGFCVVGAVTISKLPRWQGPAAGLLMVVVLATGLLTLIGRPEVSGPYLLIAIGGAALFTVVFCLNATAWRLFTELDAKRQTEVELALMKERVRFASDLHDIQGHTLHVVKLKTALAQKLVGEDPSRVDKELRQVQELISETISQTNKLAYGNRRLTLSAEIENAKNLFEAAGIRVNVNQVEKIRDEFEEPMSLVLREATTNILRHAEARSVGIVLNRASIAITNDGCAPGPAPQLRGLAALRTRVRERGGEMEIAKCGRSFVTAATFPGTEKG